MEDKELVMKLEEDISWLEQGCTTENEICEHIKQAIKTIIQHKETETPWHTETPKEDGYYLCHIQFIGEDYESDEEGYDIPYWFKNGSWEGNDENVRIIAWQKIDPYKEKNNV